MEMIASAGKALRVHTQTDLYQGMDAWIVARCGLHSDGT